MKIEQGYTLSQFIDLMHSVTYERLLMRQGYYSIIKYNKFLKQHLKKEMFVNEVEEKVLFENVDICNGVIFLKDILIDMEYIDLLYPTLSDLFEATNGELKLKNVEL